VSVVGGGTIDGNGWDWWRNVSAAVNASNTYFHQRPKLVEFVDCKDVLVSNLTLRNSPFWTLHPIFCTNVRVSHLRVLAPRDHGNTDGIDPDSCDNVHVTDCVVDVGDDAVSVKSGLHWKTKAKVPAQNYGSVEPAPPLHCLHFSFLMFSLVGAVFERVTLLFRNFAIGSDISGDVRNITFRDGTIGDDLGSSPWAIKIKTDSQEGGVADGIFFRNVRIGTMV
jgi:polygalacturonase